VQQHLPAMLELPLGQLHDLRRSSGRSIEAIEQRQGSCFPRIPRIPRPT
jgi:hypothetical protein